ncbi:MAG TPA: 50S ribosomal protein L22 [Ktedonobacterales bacterium]|jgi:large subunit ribosomal protein L22|nr:50S ribosomal protein L22 [Ktedonobacterales bacterium]
MQTRAIAKNVGHPPRKVRRVTDAIKGRRVTEALAILKFLPNMPARDVYKVVASAAANAENNYSLDPDELWVINAITDEGVTVKRFRARSHGRSSRILRRSSHITVYVSDDPQDLPKSARQRKRR